VTSLNWIVSISFLMVTRFLSKSFSVKLRLLFNLGASDEEKDSIFLTMNDGLSFVIVESSLKAKIYLKFKIYF